MRYRHRYAVLVLLTGLLLILPGAGPRAVAGPHDRVAPAPEALQTKLVFSGVADDGQKGGASRKKATSIHCTNLSGANATIQVKLYQYNGVNIYTSGVVAGPMRTFTFSTQGTTVYFDDVIFGSGGGTDAIYQGFAQVLSDAPKISCTAQVLDPLGYPPVYMDKLTMHDANGAIVGDVRKISLPAIRRS